MRQIVEFKVDQVGLRWEDIPVTFSVDMTDTTFYDVPAYCDELAGRISRASGQIVRWEFQGVGQGHYTTPVLVNYIYDEEDVNG